MPEENEPVQAKAEDAEPKNEKDAPAPAAKTKAGGHKVGIPEDLEP
ncbi:hypothetical protein ACWGHD_40085 [Streptomyces xanthophaeus]